MPQKNDDEIKKFHELAKDAGNKLRAYILSVASGATGVFFFTLADMEMEGFTIYEKSSLFLALISFVLTVVICLYELSIDSQRFYFVANELKKPDGKQKWDTNNRFKRQRLKLLYATYTTLISGVLSLTIYLALRLFI